jgi:lambda family phage portal protein
MAFNNENSLARKISESLDSVVGIVSPQAAVKRKMARFYYDAVDTSDRLNKKRSGLGGTADTQLDQHSLWKQREICRDLERNNPIVSGLLETECDGVVGDGVDIQARTKDKGWNKAAEELWQEEMIDNPCDITGVFNFNQYLWNMFYSYRRDGDMATIYTDYGLQAIEGEQIGTPFGQKKPENFKITNGVAYSNLTGKRIGFYIGKPAENGFYIEHSSYKKYHAENVHFHFHPRRFSQSRGQPAFTPSIRWIDHLTGYCDAELVAAKINACFSVFITKKYPEGSFPLGFTGGVSPSGQTQTGKRLEKIEPGMIEYGEPGEDVKGVGMGRPSSEFDPFTTKMLSFIGRPLCMPLMLITLDFSGATFMNARIAYQKVQSKWQKEQKFILKPFASRTWNWKINQWVKDKKLSKRDDMSKHEVICATWPYVDPYKEALADEQELKNGSTTRTRINARKGQDFENIVDERKREDEYLESNGVVLDQKIAVKESEAGKD